MRCEISQNAMSPLAIERLKRRPTGSISSRKIEPADTIAKIGTTPSAMKMNSNAIDPIINAINPTLGR